MGLFVLSKWALPFGHRCCMKQHDTSWMWSSISVASKALQTTQQSTH